MDIIANDLINFEHNIEEFQNSRQSLMDNYDSMVSHIEELSSMWEGTAHDTLADRFKSDNEKVLNLITQLDNVFNNLQFAQAEYTDCENGISALIAEMQV